MTAAPLRGSPVTAAPRGFALLLVFWALALLSLLVGQIGVAGRDETALALNLRRAAVLQQATDGAVEAAAFALLQPGAALPPGGAGRTLAVPGASVALQETDLAGLVDPNQAPDALMAALLRQAGDDPAQATATAAALAAWRYPAPQTGPRAPQNLPYLAAGREYGPPGAPFESVDELGLVLGMTPVLLDALRPYLTIYGRGRTDPALAPEPVRRALALVGTPIPLAAGAATAAGAPPVQAVRTVRIVATGTDGSGARFVRRAVLRLGASPRGFVRILAWQTSAADAPATQ